MTDFPPALLTKKQYLLSELQTRGLQLADVTAGAAAQARPITRRSPCSVPPSWCRCTRAAPRTRPTGRRRRIATASRCCGRTTVVCEITFPPAPQFYSHTTADGIPYWKIAQLHARDTLATTVLQTCVRYGNSATKCQFCAIGESLKGGRTIARKTPAQLAEVAAVAQRLDGVRNVVMTTGTPPTDDRGAAVLAEGAAAIKTATGLPIQAQCEPPADFRWFDRLRAAGVDALGARRSRIISRRRRSSCGRCSRPSAPGSPRPA